MGTWALAFSASAAERMIPASSAESTVLFHGIKSLLRKTQTQRSWESCTAIYKIEIAKPSENSDVHDVQHVQRVTNLIGCVRHKNPHIPVPRQYSKRRTKVATQNQIAIDTKMPRGQLKPVSAEIKMFRARRD
jgi:hypothetical protein